MSWLDGMVDESEALSQTQRLDTTRDRPEPGLFSGGYDALGKGLVRGVIEAGGAAESLAVGSIAKWAELYIPSQGPADQASFDESIDQTRRTIGSETAEAVIDLRPDPATSGLAAQIIGEAAAVLPRTVLGAVAGGPLGAAVAAGAPAGYAGKQVAIAEGIDEDTATTKGAIDAVTMGVGAILPAAKFVKPLLGDFAIAVGANAGLGMAGRGSTSALLESAGYTAQAAQYKAMDGTAVAIDAVMGAAFFGIGRAGVRKPTTEQIAAALSENKAQHFDVGTAPGAPTSPRAAVAHRDALAAAIEQITRGEPVTLPDSIHSAEFLRADNVAPERMDPVFTVNEGERAFTYVIRDNAAPRWETESGISALDNEAGRIVGEIRGNEYIIRNAEIQPDYQGKGFGVEAYADLVRRAEASGRTVASDVEVTTAAARVYESLKKRGFEVTRNPSAKVAVVDGIEKLVSGSGPVFKVSRPFRIEESNGGQYLKASSKFGSVGGGVKDGALKINFADVLESARGKGHGKALYKNLIDEALSRGLRVTSDSTVEMPAVRVYEALKKEGYAVKENKFSDLPADEDLPAGARFGLQGKPVFEVSRPSEGAALPGKTEASGQSDIFDEAGMRAVNEIMARGDDIQIPTGATDADGNPVTISAKQLLAEADADIARAEQDASGFAAAATCFLQRGQ